MGDTRSLDYGHCKVLRERNSVYACDIYIYIYVYTLPRTPSRILSPVQYKCYSIQILRAMNSYSIMYL